MIQNNILKLKDSYLTVTNLTIIIIFFVPSPYKTFTFPIEDTWTFLTLMLLIFLGGKSKKSLYIFLVVILVLKVYSIIFSNNFYSVCYLSVGAQNQSNECVETFDQYSIFTNNEIQYELNIDEGVEGDEKTYHGHSDSSWNTDYLTGLNYENSVFSPSSSVGEWNYDWIPFRVIIKKSFSSATSLNLSFFGDIKIYSNKELIYEGSNYENIEITIDSFSKILNLLKEKNIDQIVMAGNIIRPSLNEINFDFNTLGLIKDFILEPKGDDHLLRSIAKFFKNKGYPLFNWKELCNDLFASEDNLTTLKPSNYANKNKEKALNIFKKIGEADIGQSLVVQNQLVIGIECFEGTDELIKRCDNYKKLGDKKILIKLSKYNQHSILDVPTIGIQTLKNLKKYNYEGLFIEKNHCIILEKDKSINFCNDNNLFLSTTNKID